MSRSSELPEDLILALAQQRGLTLDRARAAELRPLAESLLARLARIGERVPRDLAPPPLGTLEDRGP